MRTTSAIIVLTLLALGACGSNDSTVTGPPDPPQEVRVPTLLRLQGTALLNGEPWQDRRVTLGPLPICVFDCDDYVYPSPDAETRTGPDGFWSLTYETECVRGLLLGKVLDLTGEYIVRLAGPGRYDEKAVICTEAMQEFDCNLIPDH